MKPKPDLDPYEEVIQRFNQKGVRYVVVGMSGINYYALDARETFGTLDFDFFIEPTLSNVKKAVKILQDLGFTVSSGEGLLRPEKLEELVFARRTLTGTTSDGLMVELLLQISGYPFSEMERDPATFTVQGIPIRVGRLNKLVHSKRLADRPKDRQFLKRYETLFKESRKKESFGDSHL